MPVHRDKDSKGCFYQWGNHGKKYYYQVGDAASRLAAQKKAYRQARAVYSTGWREK